MNLLNPCLGIVYLNCWENVMPYRNQSIIRRDINRLFETIERNLTKSTALKALVNLVKEACDQVNSSWQNYQAAAIKGDKERQERDNALKKLLNWIQIWRPIIFLHIHGASSNIRSLPSGAATPDDLIRVAEDMKKVIASNPQAESIREDAQNELGDLLENAKKETSEATEALPLETEARSAYSEACRKANDVLVRGTEVIRAIFGRTSPEYKQFISRASAKEAEEIDKESSLGEE